MSRIFPFSPAIISSTILSCALKPGRLAALHRRSRWPSSIKYAAQTSVFAILRVFGWHHARPLRCRNSSDCSMCHKEVRFVPEEYTFWGLPADGRRRAPRWHCVRRDSSRWQPSSWVNFNVVLIPLRVERLDAGCNKMLHRRRQLFFPASVLESAPVRYALRRPEF